MHGLDRLLDLYRIFIESAAQSDDSLEQAQTREVATPAEPKLRVLQAFGGMRVSLDLLERLSLSKLPEQIPSGRFEPTPDNFDAGLFLVRVRLRILPLLAETWQGSVIKQAPPNIVRLVFRTIVNVLHGQGEDGSNVPGPARLGGIFPPPTLPNFGRRHAAPSDANRIQQLADMGFPRAAAIAALQRFSNSVPNSAEFLISHPDFVASHSHDDGTTTPADQQQSQTGDQNSSEPSQAGGTVAGDVSHSMDVEPPVEQPSPEQLRSELSQKRNQLHQSFFADALELIGTYKQLVFDLQEACNKLEDDSQPEDTQLLSILMQRLSARTAAAVESCDSADSVTSELRLLALLTQDSSLRPKIESRISAMAELLTRYLPSELNSNAIPAWLSFPLLVAENILLIVDSPRQADLFSSAPMPAVDHKAIHRGPKLLDLRERLFKIGLVLMRCETCEDDHLIAALRTLGLLTRDFKFAQRFVQEDVLSLLIAKVVHSSGESPQELLMLIFRHIIELPAVLDEIVRSDIRHWLERQKGRSVDMSSFVLGNKHAALRDPSVFSTAAVELCKLAVSTADPSAVFDGPFHVELAVNTDASGREELNGQSDASTAKATVEKRTEAQQAEALRAVDLGEDGKKQVDSVVHLLMSQLLALHKVILAETAPTDLSEASTSAESTPESVSHKRWSQARFFLASLAELLYSYDACKSSFLRFSFSGQSSGEDDFLGFLLTDIIAQADTTTPPQGKEKKKGNGMRTLRIKEWAGLVLVSLCAAPVSPFADQAAAAAQVSTDEQQVRRVVLKSVSQALQHAFADSHTTTLRYGRLSSLSECVFNLLTGTAPSSQHTGRRSKPPSHEINEDMGKLMLELNMPATLASALSDVDLNFPHVRGLINRILRPLQVLSRVAKRAGPPKSSESKQEQEQTGGSWEESETEASEEGSSSMLEGDHPHRHASSSARRDETPDVYSSSALGMFQGELEGHHQHHHGGGDDDDDDMMDEDDIMMEDEDVMMDDGEDLAPSEESDLTDEEEGLDVADLGEGVDDEDGDADEADDDDDGDDDDEEDDDDEDEDDSHNSMSSDESDPDDVHHHRHHHHHHHRHSHDMMDDLEMEDGADPMVVSTFLQHPELIQTEAYTDRNGRL